MVHLFHVVYSVDQMDENDLEDIWRDYSTRPKEVCQGLTRDMMVMVMMMSSVPESQ